MSEFACQVVRVKLHPHPNADAIELAQVGDYMSIVKKGQFRDGDLAVYIPEQAVLPEWLLKEMGFWDSVNEKGMLSGTGGRRVRAIKLRGVVSQGLLYPTKPYDDDSVLVDSMPHEGNQGAGIVPIGGDAAECMGVVKWEPTLPAHMAGKAVYGDLESTFAYDFENIKKYPEMFEEGDDVVITEKIHGTNCQVALIPRKLWEGKKWAESAPEIDVLGNYRGIVTSKGQGAKGIVLDPTQEGNLYVDMAKRLELWERLLNCVASLGLEPDVPIFLFGEIFGPNVQKGFDYGQAQPEFQAFDLYIGTRNKGGFEPFDSFADLMTDSGIAMVPLLYRGAFSKDTLARLTSGSTTLGAQGHIREGVVVKCAQEKPHKQRRRIAKSVSDDYLLLKEGKTTEYQ